MERPGYIFGQFSYKNWPKIKNLGLNESLPLCLRQTVSRRHELPQVLVSGGEGAPGPPIAGSATDSKPKSTHADFLLGAYI